MNHTIFLITSGIWGWPYTRTVSDKLHISFEALIIPVNQYYFPFGFEIKNQPFLFELNYDNEIIM